MVDILLHIGITMLAFVSMEGVAWLSHKYIMHGFLWHLHEDHHTRENILTHFEKNDFFFLLFATPGITLILFGVNELSWMFFAGLGIALYGLAYFLIHDVFIHRRLKWLRNSNSAYFRAIRRAHKVHHKHLGKEHGECFGMLWVPIKYFKSES
ncbi:MAG: sterol desaturase family protein [Flavobacteriales bacterium]|nr:sterol desaturase family protein [Flavobacteriales bacterium]